MIHRFSFLTHEFNAISSMFESITHIMALASICFVIFAILRLLMFRRWRPAATAPALPVTVLKPVCGLEPGLYENLKSFCEQDYPGYQVIFGVSDRNDPALEVINDLMCELSDKDLSVVINDHMIGSNRKVSNLANIYSKAKHDILVIADSDMQVDKDYLRSVVMPLQDPTVGVVTCLYSGIARGGLASVLGAAFINEWFLPSVLVALSFQKIKYCFGSTMVVRRDLLEQIGGFARFAQLLADDYMLGKIISDAGYKVYLSPYVVGNVVYEPNIKALFQHELRWAVTVRSVRPVGYSLSCITYAVPMTLLYMLASSFRIDSVIMVGAAVGLRILMHFTARYSLQLKSSAWYWLMPFRDILSFAVWAASFFSKNIHWRQYTYSLQNDGQITTTEQMKISENVIP